MPEPSPWLTYEEASDLLDTEYNVQLAARTIENKCQAGEIPSELLAGQRRIHRDKLREWTLKGDGS